MADENIHVSNRHLDDTAYRFRKRLSTVLTDAAKIPVPLHIVATKSPLLPVNLRFKHNGESVAYEGIDKDLAVIKYCSCGVRDENDGYYHVLQCLQHVAKPEQGRPAEIPLENWLVVFVTTDFGYGMKQALNWLASCSSSMSWVVPISVPKNSAKDRGWVEIAAEILGADINRRFSHCTLDGWGLMIRSVNNSTINN